MLPPPPPPPPPLLLPTPSPPLGVQPPSVGVAPPCSAILERALVSGGSRGAAAVDQADGAPPVSALEF